MIRARGSKDTRQVLGYGADPRAGRERRVRRYVHGSKEAARDVERQLVVDARAGGIADGQLTVKDLLEAWLQHAQLDLVGTTRCNYRRLIDQRIAPELGAVKVAKLTPAALDHYYAQLRTELSSKTVRNVHAVLRRALNQAQRWVGSPSIRRPSPLLRRS